MVCVLTGPQTCRPGKSTRHKGFPSERGLGKRSIRKRLEQTTDSSAVVLSLGISDFFSFSRSQPWGLALQCPNGWNSSQDSAPAPTPTPGTHLLQAPGLRRSRVPSLCSPDLVSLLSAWQINSDQQNNVAELEGVWDGRTDESLSRKFHTEWAGGIVVSESQLLLELKRGTS